MKLVKIFSRPVVLIVTKSGPSAKPSLPCLWQIAQRPVKITFPFAASPFNASAGKNSFTTSARDLALAGTPKTATARARNLASFCPRKTLIVAAGISPFATPFSSIAASNAATRSGRVTIAARISARTRPDAFGPFGHNASKSSATCASRYCANVRTTATRTASDSRWRATPAKVGPAEA